MTAAADGREPIDIERLLVWTYHRQRAHIVSGLGLLDIEAAAGDLGGGGSNASACCRILEVGGRVDGGGGSAGHLHPDAERVHRAVLKGRARHEVIYFARTLGRPDPMIGAEPIVQAVLDARGRVRRVYESWDRHRNHGRVLTRVVLSQASIDFARRRYALWHAGLVALQRELRLETWLPIGPAAPREPWR